MGNKASDDKDEIIIKCTLAEIVKQFFKETQVVWHDPNANSPENQKYLPQIEKLCLVKTFTEWEKASEYIKGTNIICHVITSGTNGELLVNEIHLAQQVSDIHIFCNNKEYHSTWAKNYQKISRIETDIKSTLEQIEQALLRWYKEASSLRINLPAFAPAFNEVDKSDMNNLHRYLRVIPQFKNRLQAKNDFVSLSKAIYSDATNVNLIAEFEKNYNEYNKKEVLRWYTRESFLYKVTNNCLRIAKSDSIQYCRLILKDIEKAIKQQYQEKSKYFNGLLYRGAYLSEQEWSSLKENLNKEIEMHGFLSVSKEKNIALNFMKSDPTKKAIITILVPKGPNDEEQGFAEMAEFSEYIVEQEVLFNVRSRFTVLEVEDEYSPALPYRHLVLLYGAQSSRRFIAEHNPFQEIASQDTQLVSCSRCQVAVHEKPSKFFFVSLEDMKNHAYLCKECLPDHLRLHNTPLLCVPIIDEPYTTKIKGFQMEYPKNSKIPFYGYECHQCQAKKQKFYFKCTQCNEEKEERSCENCVENLTNCMKMHHAVILENNPFSLWCQRMSEAELNHVKFQNELFTKNDHLFRQAEMYFESQQYQKALEYYSLYIQQNQKQDVNLASSYSRIGAIYDRQGEHNKALEYHLKCLRIDQSINGEKSVEVAASYHNIGLAYYNQADYKMALKYYLRSLDIRKSLFGENQPDIADAYNNIGLVYYSLGDCKNALEHYSKSLKIEKLIHGDNHPKIANSYNNMGLAYFNQGEYQMALDYFPKSWTIRRAVYGDNHPDTASSYNNIGLVNFSLGEFKKAFDNFSRCLEIRKLIFEYNHPEIGTSFNNIGLVYFKQAEFKRALDYHLLSLEIRKAVHGENHPDTASSYNNVGLAYEGKGEYEKALEYSLKSLEIRKAVYGDIHPDTATSYNNIGSAYSEQNESKKALEYFSKSLEIRKSLYGDNHPDTAASYTNIGTVYTTQEEYTKAIDHHLKSLRIHKSIFGDLHPSTAASYNNIGSVYFSQEEYDKALENYFKSLKIHEIIFGENHPLTAISYKNIGLVYAKQGEYEKALGYLSGMLDQ